MKTFDSNEDKLEFRKTLFGLLKTLVGLSLLLAAIYFGIGFHKPYEQILNCNAEKTITKNGKLYFKVHRAFFEDAKLQSSDYAHSHKYSVKMESNDSKGLGYTFYAADGDEDLWISVWRYHPKGKQLGKLACRAGEYYQESTEIKERQDSGWEKLFIRAYLPLKSKGEQIEIFCIHEGDDPIYFDDLHIDFRRADKGK